MIHILQRKEADILLEAEFAVDMPHVAPSTFIVALYIPLIKNCDIFCMIIWVTYNLQGALCSCEGAYIYTFNYFEVYFSF